jgi:hypothetical protein
VKNYQFKLNRKREQIFEETKKLMRDSVKSKLSSLGYNQLTGLADSLGKFTDIISKIDRII